ncbi:MAG: DUF2232 domain-containing protein [Gemmatimonadota bacterium]
MADPGAGEEREARVDPSASDSVREAGGRDRSWVRALALFLAVLGMTVVSPSVLVGIPLIVLVLVLRARRFGALLAAALAALLAFGGVGRDGVWFVERGWAILLGGWFVALTLRWPGARLTSRVLGAVGGSVAVFAALLTTRLAPWPVLDWLMAQRIRTEIMAGLSVLRGADQALPESLVSGVYRMADAQVQVFPAVLALASMAGLAVAWWLYVTLSRGRDGGLGPVRDFGFTDQLVWLLIAGLALVLFGGEGALGRAGWNAVVFMGALYAVRGVAVTLFLTGGISLLWGALFLVALLFLWPVIAVSAAVIGLGDTWLKVRERAGRLVA